MQQPSPSPDSDAALPGRRRSPVHLSTSRQLELCELALDRIRHGLCVFDDQQRLVLFNRRYAEMYGIDPSQLWVGMTLREVVDLRYAAGTGPTMTADEYVGWRGRIGRSGQVVSSEMTLRDGEVYAIHHEPTGGGGWVATFEDITGRVRAEAHVRHMALHDALTGLPNRTQFAEHLTRTLARLRGEDDLEDHRPAPAAGNWLAAVLRLGLHHFKDLNDTLGHVAGDSLLRLVATRIGRCLRAEDMLARLGGDEFAILLHQRIVNGDEVAELARRVISVVSAPYALDGQEVRVDASVGIAVCASDDQEGVGPDLLLRQSDMALHNAKAKGGGVSCFFQARMHAGLHRRLQMERDLRRALAAGGLEVHFQAVEALAPRRIVGAEALVRWRHPEHGMVSPAEFIPLAESAGLVGELGAWVLRTACAHAAEWGGLRLAVNLSPEQVRQPGLVEQVVAVLAETGFAPSRLELEITEGILLHDTAATLATLDRLRALGIGIALDDFGTGYSSLSYLRRFPFNRLKVDQSFVAGMADPCGAAIVQAVITLGHSLGMRVTAEGIETEAQLDLLRGMGCDEGQGYLLGAPCPAKAFAQRVTLCEHGPRR